MVPPAQATRLRTTGRSEGWEQTHASVTGRSNMQFAVETPIAVAAIGFWPITRTFVAPTTNSGDTEKIARRRIREGLRPGPSSTGTSSTARRTPPNLAGSGEHRRGEAGRHWDTVAQLGFVHVWLRSRGGGSLSANRGVAVVADLLILEREKQPSVPLDDVPESRYILPQRRDSEPWVARNAGNRPMLRRPGNLICNLPPKCQLRSPLLAFVQ